MAGRDELNPYSGRRGLFNRVNRVVFRFTGPAQVGIGRPEAPYVAPTNPVCPICGKPMAAHQIDRSPGGITRLHCPADAETPAA